MSNSGRRPSFSGASSSNSQPSPPSPRGPSSSDSPPPFAIDNGMVRGANGRPLIVDEIDIPSPHTRRYQALEANIHTMSDEHAQNFARQLRRDIRTFDQHDTLDNARQQGRMVYRSWPNEYAQQEIALSNPQQRYTSGFASLSITRDPPRVRQLQDLQRRGLQEDPFTSSPATLLGRDDTAPERLWSGSGPGMVSTLQPEEHYVAMEALNRRVQQTQTSPELTELNESLRAEVTRPHLFENADLSSMVMALPGETGRFGRPSMGSGNPSADFRLRENATRYQSYMAAHGNDRPEIHNEMAVYYRASGLHAPAQELVDRWEPRTTTRPRFSLGPLNFGSETVSAPSVLVRRDENPSRDRNALQNHIEVTENPVRNQHGNYPILKE